MKTIQHLSDLQNVENKGEALRFLINAIYDETTEQGEELLDSIIKKVNNEIKEDNEMMEDF